MILNSPELAKRIYNKAFPGKLFVIIVFALVTFEQTDLDLFGGTGGLGISTVSGIDFGVRFSKFRIFDSSSLITFSFSAKL